MNEQQARAIKADRLLDALAVVAPERNADVVRLMSDAAWANLETVAGVNPASATTRALVIERLERRAAIAADPFAGFPVRR